MRVAIYDMDWVHKFTSVPNHKAMKLSSYHKQKQDVVYFVEDAAELSFQYDLLYVIRENKRTPFPTMNIIDSPKAKLIGKEFFYYDNQYDIDNIIGMLRPDYGLYPAKEYDAYGNAHVAQFLHKTTLLPIQQNFMNEAAKGHKKLLVVDDMLWRAEKNIILEVLERLKGYKNIAFLKPISLNKVVFDTEIRESFLALNFTKGTIFRFRNDAGSEYEVVKKIIDFMHDFKEMTTSKVAGFPVKAVMYDHWENPELGIEDLQRCLMIVDYAKQKEISVLLKTPRERLTTPYWAFFDIMQVWTEYSPRISYVEAMLHSTMKRNGLKWYEILNDMMKWHTPRVFFLLHVLTTYPAIVRDYGTRQWKEKKIDIGKVKIEEIVRSRFRFEQQDILEKLQHELTEEI